MIQLISFIIFIISFGTLLFLIYRKIPMLITLPKNGHHGFKKPKTLKILEKKIKDMHFDFFEKQMFLHLADFGMDKAKETEKNLFENHTRDNQQNLFGEAA